MTLSRGAHEPQPRIVRLLPVLDDEDILERNLDWYAAEDIETVAVDNGSGAATREICEAAHRDGRIASLARFDEPLPSWPEVAGRLLALAAERRPELVLLAAVDEFLETPDGESLRPALSADLAAGSNLIRVSVAEFCMTVEDDPSEADPLRRLQRYSKRAASARVRGARWTDLGNFDDPRHCTLGHGIEEKASQRVYVLRHYPLRSPGQAMARARTGRLRPMLAGSFASPLRGLIDDPEDLMIRGPGRLARYAQDHRWTERESGGAAYLDNASRVLRRLRREHASLKRRYGEVLLEHERLLAAGTAPQPAPIAASAEWYDERYRLNLGKYDSSPEASPYAPAWHEIITRVGLQDTVLEIGCGPGQLALLLHRSGVERYVGFDFSQYAIELARRRLPDADLRVDDARTSHLVEQGGCDVVICTEVLEHLDDDLALLRRVPAGTRVLATVPSFDSTSHLRFFSSVAEVRGRYEPLLAGLDVEAVGLRRGNTLFLLDGHAR